MLTCIGLLLDPVEGLAAPTPFLPWNESIKSMLPLSVVENPLHVVD